MATPIRIKRSTTAGVVPTTGDIANAELAVNLSDQILYTSDGSTVFEIGNHLSTQLYIGNTTVNAVANSTTLKLSNSTVNTQLSIPTSAQWTGGDYFLNANGSWIQVTSGGVNTAAQYTWTNTHIFQANVTLAGLIANGSIGTPGQLLASNGSATYWTSTSPGGASVTTADTPPGSPADGDLWWNSTDGQLYVYYDDGDSQQWVQAALGTQGEKGDTGATGPRALTIVYPTASEDITLLYTDAEHVVSRVSTVMLNSAASTVTFTIRYGTDRSAAGTEIKTGGMICSSNTTANNVTVFDSATIPADNFVWLETSGVTGSVQEFHVSLNF